MKLHQWAAIGLAKTCWTTYADQVTGLGPDGMVMTKPQGTDPHAGKWIEQVELWEQRGEVGQPPGLQDVPPAPAGSRDYISQNKHYLLRPEVCFFTHLEIIILKVSSGGGKLLHPLENYRR
jgi:mannosyl-oligosaccharide alpha-1,2-mannosidase